MCTSPYKLINFSKVYTRIHLFSCIILYPVGSYNTPKNLEMTAKYKYLFYMHIVFCTGLYFLTGKQGTCLEQQNLKGNLIYWCVVSTSFDFIKLKFSKPFMNHIQAILYFKFFFFERIKLAASMIGPLPW